MRELAVGAISAPSLGKKPTGNLFRVAESGWLLLVGSVS
jgi:hypothetical protein